MLSNCSRICTWSWAGSTSLTHIRTLSVAPNMPSEGTLTNWTRITTTNPPRCAAKSPLTLRQGEKLETLDLSGSPTGGKLNKTLAPLTLTALFLVASCASPAKDAEYASINDLGAAYEQAVGNGMKCSETKNSIDDYGWVQTGCGQTTILMMFTSDAKREEIKQKNPLDPGRRLLQSKNWLIEGAQFEIEKAQQVLGGQIID